MIVKFNVKDAQISERILGTMESKIHMRLDKYFKSKKGEDTVTMVKIAEKKPIFTVEINLAYGGYQLRTEVSEKNGALPALDRALDTMERQITKCKERLSRKGRGQHLSAAGAGQGTTDLMPGPESEDEYKVVRVKIYEMKPMNTQEAILQMEFLGHNFYVFSNIENGKICTAYRRNDGDYGLIEPAD